SVEVLERGSDGFAGFLPKWEASFPTLAWRFNAIVTIAAERVKLMTTPPYDDGATEDEMIAIYKAKFAEIYP
ncbi:MAG: pyridoxamine 5'-phosphate oxidase family protein, partial [Rhizobiaceae bacterium]